MPAPVTEPLSDDRRDLAARYLPLARSLARPLAEAYPHIGDEFESAACLALIGAARKFDPARGVKFPTYARYRILGALKDVLRAAEPPTVELTPATLALNAIVGREPPPDPGRGAEERDNFEAAIRPLTAPYRHICRRLYADGASQVEVARELGMSQSRVSLMHREALAVLAEARTA